jgi:hypothetical protein
MKFITFISTGTGECGDVQKVISLTKLFYVYENLASLLLQSSYTCHYSPYYLPDLLRFPTTCTIPPTPT